MKKTTLTLTAAVLGLSLGGAAFAQTDSTRPGAGTPPASATDSAPAPGGAPATTPGSGSMSSGSMGSGSTMGSSTMTTAPDATGGGGAMAGIDAKQLLGTDVKNAENEKVGEVQAVQLDSAGKVRNLIVGVGGFMGLGERAVAVEPSALSVADNGDTLRTTLTKDQLKAMPEYEYSDKSYRGKLFNDTGVVNR